ncbi:hypothetical protein TrRE_jg4389 [Triparma retinervis]|uniref:Uncharacterized protein n=1 Tax=Triparma retinervis TaxID=2557542 RepID=A0A9W6ZYN1_9STRA|nr:hypothetical protein TrRE_jg4389 [Triparma retinervis]
MLLSFTKDLLLPSDSHIPSPDPSLDFQATLEDETSSDFLTKLQHVERQYQLFGHLVQPRCVTEYEQLLNIDTSITAADKSFHTFVRVRCCLMSLHADLCSRAATPPRDKVDYFYAMRDKLRVLVESTNFEGLRFSLLLSFACFEVNILYLLLELNRHVDDCMFLEATLAHVELRQTFTELWDFLRSISSLPDSSDPPLNEIFLWYKSVYERTAMKMSIVFDLMTPWEQEFAPQPTPASRSVSYSSAASHNISSSTPTSANPRPAPHTRSATTSSIGFSPAADASSIDDRDLEPPPTATPAIPRFSILPSELPPHCISYIKNQVAKQNRQEGSKAGQSAPVIECSVSEPDEYAKERQRLLRLEMSRLEMPNLIPPLNSTSTDMSALTNNNSGDQTMPNISLADSSFSNFSSTSLNTPASALRTDNEMTKSSNDTTFHTANSSDNTFSPLFQLQHEGTTNTPPFPPNSQTRDVASLLTPLTNVSSPMNHVCYYTHYFIKKVSPKFYVAVVLEEENDKLRSIARRALRRDTLKAETIAASRKVVESFVSNTMSNASVWGRVNFSELGGGAEEGAEDAGGEGGDQGDAKSGADEDEDEEGGAGGGGGLLGYLFGGWFRRKAAEQYFLEGLTA